MQWGWAPERLDLGATEYDLTPVAERGAVAKGVFDYLPKPGPFLQKMRSVTTRKVIAGFPGHSQLRGPARKLPYKLAGEGSVFFYDERDVRQLAADAGFADYKLVHIYTSGRGFILVGDCSR